MQVLHRSGCEMSALIPSARLVCEQNDFHNHARGVIANTNLTSDASINIARCVLSLSAVL